MKWTIIGWTLLLPCVFSTFSCSNLKIAGLNLQGKDGTGVSQKSEIFTLLNYFRHLESLSKERLDEEHENVQELFSRKPGLLDRLKLAVLLSWPNTSFQDHRRSLDLLTKYSEDPAREDRLLREMSFFLSYFIQRIRSEEERLQALTRKLNEGEARNKKLHVQEKKELEQNRVLKEQNEKLKKAIRRLKKENEKEENKRENLQRMIEGLKSIEKNLMKQDEAISNESGNKSSE